MSRAALPKQNLQLVSANRGIPPASGAPPPIDNGGSPPHDGGNNGGDMSSGYVTHAEFQEARAEINERFARIETRLEQTATKADLSDVKFDVTKWIVGTAITMSAVGITVMTFVLNNAIPTRPPASPAPPIIINIPASPPTATATEPNPTPKP